MFSILLLMNALIGLFIFDGDSIEDRKLHILMYKLPTVLIIDARSDSASIDSAVWSIARDTTRWNVRSVIWIGSSNFLLPVGAFPSHGMFVLESSEHVLDVVYDAVAIDSGLRRFNMTTLFILPRGADRPITNAVRKLLSDGTYAFVMNPHRSLDPAVISPSIFE